MFVEEGSDSRKVRIERVPHHHLQPADLHLGIQTIKQRRVAVGQTHHHIWEGMETQEELTGKQPSSNAELRGFGIVDQAQAPRLQANV